MPSAIVQDTTGKRSFPKSSTQRVLSFLPVQEWYRLASLDLAFDASSGVPRAAAKNLKHFPSLPPSPTVDKRWRDLIVGHLTSSCEPEFVDPDFHKMVEIRPDPLAVASSHSQWEDDARASEVAAPGARPGYRVLQFEISLSVIPVGRRDCSYGSSAIVEKSGLHISKLAADAAINGLDGQSGFAYCTLRVPAAWPVIKG
ncbi:hypothetical protein PCANC_23581 [Puccinia coronata f. sp. avenae]|uniref:Uncharacterized protein n=1 Tax=Puccinia coronata f. sp. avenae TaxID=200324 RepID=A0A2N5TM98_9BASI|nr:hypothetical protein PCANC_23581 [Puccinia coronata f. sp. avenae]PLW51103.1 hypothetical protein PCASD_02451 [Puccinia coronata f. sp. avenae]